MKKILVCAIGCFVAIGIAAAADDDLVAKPCEVDTCAAADCPSGTDHQTGACGCNVSCGCYGNIICYNAGGVVIGNKRCSGTCKRPHAAPGDPVQPDGGTLACNGATDDNADPNAEKKPEAPKAEEKKPADPPAQPEPAKQPQH